MSGADHPKVKPELKFGRGGVAVTGVKPGTKIAWIAMIREPRAYHSEVVVLRGYGPARPDATFEIAREAADQDRGIWAVADVDAGTAISALTPEMKASKQPIVVHAEAGQSVVTFASAGVDLLYVRPKRGAWAFTVSDGGTRDGDGEVNGSIAMPLASLRPFKGNPHPPESVEAGDLLLVIDRRGLRTAVVEVTR